MVRGVVGTWDDVEAVVDILVKVRWLDLQTLEQQREE